MSEIVRRVENRAGRIVGNRGDLIDVGPFDVDEVFSCARVERDRTDVRDRPGCIESGIQFSGTRIDEGARDRPERMRREIGRRRQRILSDSGEILLLEILLPRDPFAPGLLERRPEHVLKLTRVIGLAARPAADPINELPG